MAKSTLKGILSARMVGNTKESLEKDRYMARESMFLQMVVCTKVNENRECSQVLVSIHVKAILCIRESF